MRVESKTGARLIQLNPDAGLDVNELSNLVKVSYKVIDDYCLMDIIKIFPVFISAKTGTFSNKTLVHE